MKKYRKFKIISEILLFSGICCWFWYAMVYAVRTEHDGSDFVRTLVISILFILSGNICSWIADNILDRIKHNISKKRVAAQNEEIIIRENRFNMNIEV